MDEITILGLLLMLGLMAEGISTRPEVEEDMTAAETPDPEKGKFNGRSKLRGQGNMTWPDGSSYSVRGNN